MIYSSSVSQLPLITSLPQSMKRISADGADIGSEYALACQRSWIQSGFEPISLNANDEIDEIPEDLKGIKFISVDRTARATTGKPHVYLHDMLDAARRITDGLVAITNADIVLNLSAETQSRIRQIKPGECLIAKRIDLQSPDLKNSGTEYFHGYDFFVFHTGDLNRYTSRDFIFGAPWWDHFFPIHMIMNGIRVRKIREKSVFHLSHTERWNEDLWVQKGLLFLSEILSSPHNARGEEPSFSSADYLERLSRIAATLRSQSSQSELHDSLNAISSANVRFIDEHREGNFL